MRTATEWSPQAANMQARTLSSIPCALPCYVCRSLSILSTCCHVPLGVAGRAAGRGCLYRRHAAGGALSLLLVCDAAELFAARGWHSLQARFGPERILIADGTLVAREL
eukprot:6208640-Pleurochrysis_carterae.AAC.1